MFKYSYLIVALFATDCLANEDEYLQCVQNYLPQAEFDGAALMVKQKCEAIYGRSHACQVNQACQQAFVCWFLFFLFSNYTF